ncbi:MAG: hypothetical protein WCF04_11765 [Candidatus Nanopelagicales bacterium]
MTTRTIVGAGLCAAMALVGGAGAAVAGEVGGNGEPVTVNGKSLCAYSGLEDEPHDPGTVQNWGHVKRAFGLQGGANSVQTPFGEEGCNAHLYPAK